MKPLVSTSVLGLVPLPQLPENNDAEWKRGADAGPVLAQALGSGDCQSTPGGANRQLVGRMGFCALLFSAIWRRRHTDRYGGRTE